MKKLILVLLSCLFLNTLDAQINHPENPELRKKAENRFVMSSDDMQQKNYAEAVKSLHWLMTEVPNYTPGIYINAYKAYEQLAAGEADKTRQAMLLDSMLITYQLKADAFNLSVREKNNLAFKYFKYFRSAPGKIEDALKAYEAAYETPEKVINNNIVSYMFMLSQSKKYGAEVSIEKAFDTHQQIVDVITIKEKAGVDKAKLDSYRVAINSLLSKLIGDGPMDCGTIDERFGPKYDESPNLNWAKRVFSLILDNKCTESPYFIKTAITIWNIEREEGMATLIGDTHAKVGDYPLAIEWYEEAFNVSENPEKKAALQMKMANVYGVEGQKAKSRDAAMKVAELDKTREAEAYTFIGNLYMGSFDDCKKEASQIDDRAIFMLAYDMYKKANNQKGMAAAMEQFPTVGQRFEKNLDEGSALKVNCWIQRSTTLRTRK